MLILLNKKYQEHFAYLDELRESGVTNMFGAAPWLQREFGMSITDAREILTDWMRCFSVRSGDENQYVDLAKLADLKDIPAVMVDRLGTEVQPPALPTAQEPQ